MSCGYVGNLNYLICILEDMRVYIHNFTHKVEKLGVKSKKCIFIRYSEHSKGYVSIGEYINGTVTKLESQYINFLENKFLNIGKVDKDLSIRISK